MSKRRGHGEGSIYQRKDGRWVAALSLGNGRRKNFYGATHKEVRDRLTEAARAHQLGLPIAAEKERLSAFLTRWLNEAAKPRVRASTFASYESLVRIHILPEIGSIALAKLTPSDVNGLLSRKLAAGLSPRRVQLIRVVLSMALKQAERWGMLPRNVAALVASPRVERHEVQPLTPDEARQLLAAVAGDRLEALYSVALAMGLRQGEALALRWQDIDIDKGRAAVLASLQRVDGKLQRVAPKTKQSRRTGALPSVVVEALRRHRNRQRQEKLLAGTRWRETGLVFTTSIGTGIDAGYVWRHFQRTLKAAGLRRMRFHDLRHSCASLLIAQGIHPKVLQATLGHATIGITMDTYGHLFSDAQRDAAVKMDAALSADTAG